MRRDEKAPVFRLSRLTPLRSAVRNYISNNARENASFFGCGVDEVTEVAGVTDRSARLLNDGPSHFANFAAVSQSRRINM